MSEPNKRKPCLSCMRPVERAAYLRGQEEIKALELIRKERLKLNEKGPSENVRRLGAMDDSNRI